MSSNISISVSNLSKCYQIYDTPRDRLLQMLVRNRRQYFRRFWAVRDVTFDVAGGETVGIIGRNGSGKSTLLQLICGTTNPTSGSIITNGRIAALLELGSGFNPEFTGRENAYMNGAVLGLSASDIDERYDDILSFADIGEFISQPVKTYSSGMVVRLAFAIAISVNPQILVIDEALAVGDAAFQRKCMRRLQELSNSGVTLLFVSHDTESVRRLCSSAIYLHQGIVKFKGNAKDTCEEYERDLFGASTRRLYSMVTTSQDTALPSDSAYLDAELMNAIEKVYGDGRVDIRDIVLTDFESVPANVFRVGSSFVVSYIVTFLEEVNLPIFGMMITTKEGICAYGVNTTGHAISAKTYAAGDKVSVTFTVENNLGVGVYYLTCGVHSTDAEQGLIYHQRRMDIKLLKSIGRDREVTAGISYLAAHIKAQSV